MRLSNTSRMTVRELLTLAIYDRSRIILGAAIPIVIGLIAAIMASSWYESSASLLFLHGSEYLAKSPVGADLTGPGLDPKQILLAEAELMDNSNLLVQVLDQIGVKTIYPDMRPGNEDRILDRFKADLNIEPIFTAGVLRVSLRNSNAEVASATLAKIIQLYLQLRNVTVGNTMNAPMTQQAEQMSATLNEAEDALHQFSLEHSISDMNTQRSRLLQLRSDLLDNQNSFEAQIVARRSERDATNSQLQSLSRTVRGNNTTGRIRELENAKASLLTMELRRKDFATRVSEGSEEVANLDLQIATVRSFLATEPSLINDNSHDERNPAYDTAQTHAALLDAEIKGLEAKTAQTVKDAASVTDQLSILDSLEQTYDRLSEAERTAEEPLLAYVPKLEELKISDELAHRLSSNVRIIENATSPTRRHSNRLIYFALGLFAAVIGGLTATFARTSLRQVCILPSEMEQWLNMGSVLVVGFKEPESAV